MCEPSLRDVGGSRATFWEYVRRWARQHNPAVDEGADLYRGFRLAYDAMTGRASRAVDLAWKLWGLETSRVP